VHVPILGILKITKKHFHYKLSMKTPPIALLNSIGFTTSAQKLVYAASLLKAATISSPAVTISPAIPAIVAKPEVIAQTAKPAREATLAVEGGQNRGYGFGELYLNSPAYPGGTPIPAISAKPASAAVVGVPAVVGVLATPAVVAPAVTALKGWEDAISIDLQGNKLVVVAEIPVISSNYLIGASATVNEITPTALAVDAWVDTKASTTPETITSEPATLEQYFYKYANFYLSERPFVGSIVKSSKVVNGVVVATKKITLGLSCNNYNMNLDSLQLDKIVKL
jgi:hypothetical protein